MHTRATQTFWTNPMIRRKLAPMMGLALAMAGGLISAASADAQVTVPTQSSIINESMRKAWADNKLTPAKPATDLEFARRVFIDVIGRIPTSEEVRDFERDKASNKRARLVHRLLYDEAYKPKDAAGKELKYEDGKGMVFEYASEYTEHWAGIWTVWTMTRGGTHEMYHNQMKYWFKTQFAKNTPHDEMVKALLTASGKGSDPGKGAVNFIMAHLGEPSPADRQVSDGPFDSVPITSRVTRLFLGVQTQCTQCHDHPFNPEWGQENFWGVNAFFRQTKRDITPAPAAPLNKKKAMDALPVTLSDSPSLNSGQRIYYERRTGVLMSIKPIFLPDLSDLEKDKADRAKKPLTGDMNKTRREVLADYIVAHDNFGKALVNRMWGQFFGRGLNEQPAVDDFGGHNKIIHPELLEKLGQELVKYKYDPKALVEWICNSEVYNLSYVAPSKEMAKPEYDVFFTRMPLKAQSPEALFESLTTATKAELQLDKATREANRDAWMKKLVQNFGDDEGNEMTFNGTIVQALLMMNGKELNEEIKRSDGLVSKTIAKASKMSPGAREAFMIEEIYLSALARRASPTNLIDYEKVDPKTKRKTILKTNELAFVQTQLTAIKAGSKDANSAYKTFLEDLFWSLLNTNEFMLNH